MKIVSRVFIPIIFIVVVYYLFFLAYEFEVSFSVKTLPGDVIQTLRIWSRSLDSAQIIEVDSFSHVRQRVSFEGREYFYNWHFKYKDSLTFVDVEISEPSRRVGNKLMVLTGEPPVEKDAGEIIKKFYDVLKYHLNLTKVEMIGKEKHGPEFCLCRSLEKSQLDKAQGMMENYLYMSTFIGSSGMKMTGFPSVRLNQWSHSLGQLKYDFCLPVMETDSLPVAHGLEYKHFDGFYALKAQYNGNYITSDRAWYELYHYANKSGYTVKGLPVEYFMDNPNFGTKEINWKAEIFLPIERHPE